MLAPCLLRRVVLTVPLVFVVALLLTKPVRSDQEAGTAVPAESRPCVDCHAFEFMQRALQDLKKTAYNLDTRVSPPLSERLISARSLWRSPIQEGSYSSFVRTQPISKIPDQELSLKQGRKLELLIRVMALLSVWSVVRVAIPFISVVGLLSVRLVGAGQDSGSVIPAESRPCVDCHAFEFMQRALQDLKKTAYNLDTRTETLLLRAEKRGLCDCFCAIH